jgi:two-component system, OmpR family, sensor histidine kinase SenX3
MRITSRRKATIFFLALGVLLAGVAVAVGMGWVIINWREGVRVFLGIIFFAAITAGIILNTTFLLREIRRNEQHDSFINAVTHELKTPVASIRLHLETLQRRNLTDEQRQRFYQLMLDDTDRLTGTVEQVLRASRAQDRRAGRQKSDVEFAALVRASVEVTRARHHLTSETMRYEEALGGATTVLVRGNQEDLHTAVQNVLDNSVKYSHGDVDVLVRLSTADDNKRVVLSVKDRGVGIPRGELKLVFRRFYRVASRSTTPAKGTGLGLFIVNAIARKHGGRAFAESDGEGHGATVTIELPRVSA